ncbi:hypothetical protein SELMODRAFT_420157 [Selaginella moellendorffii]|uniref:Uncharacterized protein n=1 Tax=Selaginella moellendorffii TaxID=88036 RepID=D8SB52_SELML|nr:hypothetical protein SELMODRAFT_420157 [Selaginella moellendorffii]
MMIPRSETRLAWPPVDHRFRDKSAGELALYGGIAVVGFAIGGSVPSSLEILLLVPEALQAIGSGRGLLDPHRCDGGGSTLVRSKKSCIEWLSGAIPNDKLETRVPIASVKVLLEEVEERDGDVRGRAWHRLVLLPLASHSERIRKTRLSRHLFQLCLTRSG